MRKIKKRINPRKLSNPYGYQKRININANFKDEANEILNGIPYEIINTSHNGDVYYFEINFPTEVLNVLLSKGKYLLKINREITEEEQNELRFLSSKDLLPKIYFVNDRIIIQKFVEGVDLRKLYLTRQITPALKEYVYRGVLDEYKKWKLLPHGDIKFSNILLTTKGKLYLIDPLLGFDQTKNQKQRRDLNFLEDFHGWHEGNPNWSPSTEWFFA